jgi:hypothetical protein
VVERGLASDTTGTHRKKIPHPGGVPDTRTRCPPPHKHPAHISHKATSNHIPHFPIRYMIMHRSILSTVLFLLISSACVCAADNLSAKTVHDLLRNDFLSLPEQTANPLTLFNIEDPYELFVYLKVGDKSAYVRRLPYHDLCRTLHEKLLAMWDKPKPAPNDQQDQARQKKKPKKK